MNVIDALLKVALLGSEWVLYLLIVLSVLSFAAMFERWLYFKRHGSSADTLRQQLNEALRGDDFELAERALLNSRSVVGVVLREALHWRAGGSQAVADAVDSELGRVRPELERGLNLLGTLGNNAPFIGLFGTVIGVIQAFHQLGAQGNKAAAMGSVMSGIAEALVATGVGIFVAIPAVVAYNAVQKRVAEIEGQVAALSKLLTAYIKTKELAPSFTANQSLREPEAAKSARASAAAPAAVLTSLAGE